MTSRPFHILAALTVLALSLGSPAPGQSMEERMMRFKAAFIYHFLDYVYWPEERQVGPFRIGILGKSPLEERLRGIAQEREVGGRKLEVRTYDNAETIRDCHLLFIPEERSKDLQSILALLPPAVLTVADTPGLARKGVGINFVVVQGKLRFEVNRQSLQTAGLQAGSQLLRLAILVDESG